MAQVIKICDNDLDTFEPEVLCEDIVESYATRYIPENGLNYNFPQPSYVMKSKDLDEFVDIKKAYVKVTVKRWATNPDYGYGIDADSGFAAIGNEMTIEQAAKEVAVNGADGVWESDGAAAPNTTGRAIAAADLVNGDNGIKELNGYLYRLFNQARYAMNDKEVERVDSVIDVVETRKAMRESPIKSDKCALITSYKSAGKDSVAAGYPSGPALSKSLQTYILPLAEIFGSVDTMKIMKGIRNTVTLYPSNLAQAILYSDGGAGWTIRTLISQMELWCPIVHPSNNARKHYDQQLDAGLKTLRIFENAQHYKSNENYSAGSRQYSWNVLQMDNRPTRIILWMRNIADGNVSDRAGHGVERLELKINSKILPVVPYVFSGNNYHRAYLDYLRVANKPLHEEGSEHHMGYHTFRDSQRLFCFDLPNNINVYENAKMYDINVNVTLQAAPANANNALVIHAVVFSEYILQFEGIDSRLAITQSKSSLEALLEED